MEDRPDITIDASKAIAELGIVKPVTFKFGSLNHRCALCMAMFEGVSVGGQTHWDGTIVLDLDGIRIASDPIEEVIAHELMHVRQAQDYPTERAFYEAYRNSMTTNRHSWDAVSPGGNLMEAEAEAWAKDHKHLVTVTGNINPRNLPTMDEIAAIKPGDPMVGRIYEILSTGTVDVLLGGPEDDSYAPSFASDR